MCAETCMHHDTFPSVKKHGKDHQSCMQEDLMEYRMERHPEKPELSKWHAFARNERLQLNFGLFRLKHRTAMLLTLNAEVEYCTQGRVRFKSWTSPVPQGRAAASGSGYHGVKTACKTLQMKD